MTRSGALQQDERGHGVRIGRIKGIPVYLAPSWFLIAVVIVGLVSWPVLATRPLYGIALGVAQALLLLVSVLGHEAAHALTARAYGMQVLRIVANLWGGHTSFEAVLGTPGRMAVVAAAGPGANAALALLSYVALHGASGGVTTRLLEGLVIINGSLAVLNLLPGMPLDGGQVVQCLVWKVTGDRNRGSVVAGWCGRAVALLVVLWFLARPLLRGEGVGPENIWALVIGSVMWTGATESINRGRTLGMLDRLRVADVVERAVFLPPDTPVRVAMDHPDLVVTTDGRGMPCLLVVSPDGATPTGGALDAPLSSFAVRVPDENVVEVSPDGPVGPVVAAMQATGVPSVVVTQQGRPYAVAQARLVNEAAARN